MRGGTGGGSGGAAALPGIGGGVAAVPGTGGGVGGTGGGDGGDSGMGRGDFGGSPNWRQGLVPVKEEATGGRFRVARYKSPPEGERNDPKDLALPWQIEHRPRRACRTQTMKTLSRRTLLAVILLALGTGGTARAQDDGDRRRQREEIQVAFQTVFYSVLEGCFADGLTDADVDQILRKENPAQGPVHFIYACPICMATERALETYRTRPDAHDKKGGKLTFGKGLTPEMHARLYSADLKERLAAIHDLEESWVARRVDALRLNPEELARTQTQLKLARDEGMSLLQNFLRQGWTNDYAPGYHEGDECALCNAAAGMKLKLAAPPANP